MDFDTKIVIGFMLVMFAIIGFFMINAGHIDSTKFAVDFHSHTSRSASYDPSSWSFTDSMRWHANKQYDAVFVTDHVGPNTILPWDAVHPGIAAWNAENHLQAYPGIEWTTDSYHLLFLNVTSWSLPVPASPTNSDTEAAINACHLQGGIAILAHPFYVPGTNASLLLSLGCDGLEVANCATPPYFFDASSFDCIKTTGTDSHNPVPLNACSYMPDSNVMSNLIANRIDNVRF